MLVPKTKSGHKLVSQNDASELCDTMQLKEFTTLMNAVESVKATKEKIVELAGKK